MKFAFATALPFVLFATQTQAARSAGDPARLFTVEAVENGSAKTIELAALLKTGPVLL